MGASSGGLWAACRLLSAVRQQRGCGSVAGVMLLKSTTWDLRERRSKEGMNRRMGRRERGTRGREKRREGGQERWRGCDGGRFVHGDGAEERLSQAARFFVLSAFRSLRSSYFPRLLGSPAATAAAPLPPLRLLRVYGGGRGLRGRGRRHPSACRQQARAVD